MRPFFIVIAGPTGVGKSDFALQLAQQLSFPVELINADMGQLYTPLSLGTAKPDYKHEPVVHHLFDCLDEPRDYTVHEFRQAVVQVMQELWARGVVPLIVGGSSFYVQSLFFPPLVAAEEIHVDNEAQSSSGLNSVRMTLSEQDRFILMIDIALYELSRFGIRDLFLQSRFPSLILLVAVFFTILYENEQSCMIV